MRQNALAEETRRNPTAKIEKIIIKPDRKRPKKIVMRGVSLWMLASGFYLRVFILLADYAGTFHIAGG